MRNCINMARASEAHAESVRLYDKLADREWAAEHRSYVNLKAMLDDLLRLEAGGRRDEVPSTAPIVRDWYKRALEEEQSTAGAAQPSVLPTPAPTTTQAASFHSPLKPGDRVVIQGLKNAARYNGTEAVIVEEEPMNGRYRVSFGEDGADFLAVKPANLTRVEDAAPSVHPSLTATQPGILPTPAPPAGTRSRTGGTVPRSRNCTPRAGADQLPKKCACGPPAFCLLAGVLFLLRGPTPGVDFGYRMINGPTSIPDHMVPEGHELFVDGEEDGGDFYDDVTGHVMEVEDHMVRRGMEKLSVSPLVADIAGGVKNDTLRCDGEDI